MAKPTQDEVKTLIAGLKEIKPKVRRYSFFGDDNWAVIDAQIWTLETSPDEDEVYDKFYLGEEDSNQRHAALQIVSWLSGEEDLEEPILEGWMSLVQE